MKIYALPAILAGLLLCVPAKAQNTGTVRTQSFLLQSEFQDGQAAGSITPQDMRDLIVTLGQGNIGFEVDFFMYSTPPASAILAKSFSRASSVIASAPIKCNAVVGATSSYTVTLKKVTGGTVTSIGTLVFAASGSANQGCTATFSSAVSFAAGDIIEATFPSGTDATIANVSISVPALQ